jgi:triphosphoribosyl-dephospho-CoA synthase
VRRLTGAETAWAAQLACLYEVSVAKPGNVSPRAGFDDARFEDFVASAVAIGPAFADAGRATVGEIVLHAVAATRRLVATNTNLGMVLLLAPLARAAAGAHAGGDGAESGFRHAVGRVLRELTVEDAHLAYEAIRLASPAGMGRVDRHDVAAETVEATLREAMALARERDAVAREYVTDFEITFTLGRDSLRASWRAGCTLADAIVTTFLTILAEVPDTLIARKSGEAVARAVSQRGAQVLAAGASLTGEGRAQLEQFDRELRDPAHALNPGTTADLVTSSLFVLLTEDGMLDRLPELAARRTSPEDGGPRSAGDARPPR